VNEEGRMKNEEKMSARISHRLRSHDASVRRNIRPVVGG